MDLGFKLLIVAVFTKAFAVFLAALVSISVLDGLGFDNYGSRQGCSKDCIGFYRSPAGLLQGLYLGTFKGTLKDSLKGAFKGTLLPVMEARIPSSRVGNL